MARDLSFLEQRVADRAAEKRSQRESDPDSYAQDLVSQAPATVAPVKSAASLIIPKSGAELRGKPVEDTGRQLNRVADALSESDLQTKNREAQRRRESDREFSLEQSTSEDTHENLILLQNIFKDQTTKIIKTLTSQHREMLKAVERGQGGSGLGGLLDLFGGKGGKPGAPGKPVPAGGGVKSTSTGLPSRVMDAGRGLFTSAKNLGASALQGIKNFGGRAAVGLEAQGGLLAKIPDIGRSAVQAVKSAAQSVPAFISRSGAADTVRGWGSSVKAAAAPALDVVRGATTPGVMGAIGRTLGTVAAPVIGGIEAYGIVNDSSKTDSEKALGVAGVAGGIAGGSAGGLAGAALGTAILPGYGTIIGGVAGSVAGYFGGEKFVSSIGTSITSSIVGSSAGELLGRGAALAMSPFSEDARRALKSDWAEGVEGMRSAIQPIADSTSSLKESLKDYLEGFRAAGGQLGSSVYNAAAALVTGARTAGGQVMDAAREGGLPAAAAALPRATRDAMAPAFGKAASELKSGVEAAGKTVAEVRTRQTSNTAGVAAGRWNESETANIRAGEAAGEKFRAGQGLTQDSKDRITKASEKYGINPEHLMTMAQMESGGNTNAVSPTGAAGLFQFTGGTAKQYGLKNRFDPDQNIDAAARLYNDNKKSLERAGIEPSLDNIYLAHQQGAGGAKQILNSASTGAPISDAVKTNIGLNVGGNAGSVQGFIDANKTALAAAGKRAQKTLAPIETKTAGVETKTAGVETKTAGVETKTTPTSSAPATPVVQASVASNSVGRGNSQLDDYKNQQAARNSEVPAGAIPARADTALSVPASTPARQVPGMASAPGLDLGAQVSTKTSQTYAPTVSASAVPQQLVGAQTPVEVPQVRMAEMQIAAAPVQQATRSTDTKSRGGSSQPTLDEVPMHITDMGLVLLQIGHV